MEHPTSNIQHPTPNKIGARCLPRIGCWMLDVRCWMFFTISLLFAGCAHFQPQPLAPEKTAAQLDARRLDDAGLKKFLEQNLGHELAGWPLQSWDLQTLTSAAFYFQPALDV